jgi:hypothetical protein
MTRRALPPNRSRQITQAIIAKANDDAKLACNVCGHSGKAHSVISGKCRIVTNGASLQVGHPVKHCACSGFVPRPAMRFRAPEMPDEAPEVTEEAPVVEDVPSDVA